MVIDARASNMHFLSPPGVDLATSDALGRIELVVGQGAGVDADPGPVPAGQVHVGTTDIQDGFYRMRLPDGLCDLGLEGSQISSTRSQIFSQIINVIGTCFRINFRFECRNSLCKALHSTHAH